MFTVTAWIKITGSSGVGTVLSYGTPTMPAAVSLSVDTDTGELSATLANSVYTSNGGTSANDGSWHQITIVWTASSATLTFLVDLNQVYSVSSVYGSNLPAGPGCLVLGQMGAGDCSATTGFSSYVIGSDFSGILGHVSAAGGSGQCVLGRHCCQRFQIVFKRRCCRVSVSPITAVTVPS